MKLQIIAILLVYNMVFLWSQTPLDNYIREGLENNESVRQQKFALNKSLYALKEARSLFFPEVSFGTSYTLSDGGRTIAIPVGDLLNPVYTSLNELTGTNRFPTVSNMDERMNPNNYYDARFRFSMPLVDAELYYYQKIKKQATEIEALELRLYQRELVKELKVAYFTYAQACKAIEIYNQGVNLAEENLRLNQALQRNQKVNNTTVLRSENELTQAQTELNSAKIRQQNAGSYFNFLLNKPLDSPITVQEVTEENIRHTIIGQHEELSRLNTAFTSLRLSRKMDRSFVIPKLRTFVDLGSQGFDWKVNNKTAYYLFGISLEWKFSLGGKDIHKVRQTEMEMERVHSQQVQVEEQLRLQITVAENKLTDARQQLQSAGKQLITAKKYYDDQNRLYREGTILYIEMLDAYHQYIRAMLAGNIALYEVLIKHAEHERANAGFELPE